SDQCTHSIKAAVFEGNSKSVFKDRQEFTGSLLAQLNSCYDYIHRNNRLRAEFSGLLRIEHYDYPEEAIREALLNCLVHRDYAFSGSVLISIFDDRIELVSLGGLMHGITLDDILFGVSVCRNEKLAALFYRLKLIEAYGTGIQKMIHSYDECAVKPEIEVTDNAFKITLPNRTNTQLAGKNEMEQQLLPLFRERGYVTRKDIETYLGVGQTAASRTVRDLAEQGTIEVVGKGPGTKYRLKNKG
ncbi:MAG: ATP-binding protein, partial [Angelakisella sp.]